MKLKQLLSGLEGMDLEGPGDVEIMGIAYHSQQVKEGELFVAIPGFKTDGHLYIKDALERGAAALVVEEGWERPEELALRPTELDRQGLTAGKVLLLDADDIVTAIQAARWAQEEGTVVVLDVDCPESPRTEELLSISDVVVVPAGFPEHGQVIKAI